MTSCKFFTIVIMTILVVVVMVSCDISGPTQVSDPPSTGSIFEASENVRDQRFRGPVLNTAVARFEIGPGEQSVVFNTGGSPPIEGLRFIFGSSPNILTQSINGIPDGPRISFVDADNPNGIPSWEVTRHFAIGGVITHTLSADFEIDIIISGPFTDTLRIIANWNRKMN
jgi:hypothetical protein